MNAKDLEKALKKELKRLVAKYGYGKETNLKWMPQKIVNNIMGRKREIHGEVVDMDLVVYRQKENEAKHALRHEYFEYVIEKVFLGRYIDLFNEVTEGYQRAFKLLAYRDKESFIEILCKIEEEENGDNEPDA